MPDHQSCHFGLNIRSKELWLFQPLTYDPTLSSSWPYIRRPYTPQPDSSSWHNFTHIHTDLTSSWHVIQLAYINMGESVNTKRESELRKDIMRKYKKTVQTAVIRYRV